MRVYVAWLFTRPVVDQSTVVEQHYVNATECAVASWLDALELGLDCIHALLPPNSPALHPDAASTTEEPGDVDVRDMPRLFPLVLNDYMIGLRQYLGLCPDADSVRCWALRPFT